MIKIIETQDITYRDVIFKDNVYSMPLEKHTYSCYVLGIRVYYRVINSDINSDIKLSNDSVKSNIGFSKQ